MEMPPVAAHMRHILLKFLPSPEIKLVSQQLCISNHLDMIRDSMWAILAVFLDANIHAMVEPKVKKWIEDVNATIMDVQNILEVIQDFYQQPIEQKQEVTSSSNLLPHARSINTRTLFISSFRRAILVDLKQIAQSLNCLLSRVVAFGLQINMIDSMDPNRTEYHSILRQEVVGRDYDMTKILQIIFQLQEGQSLWDISDDEPFVFAITGKQFIGKSILARMVYHHPLVYEVFKHRIWVDVLHDASIPYDHKQIARECARYLAGTISSIDDFWSLIRHSFAQTRFLLILDGFKFITEKNIVKLEELLKNLICLGAPGSRVIITCVDYSIEEYKPMVYSKENYKLRNISQDAWNTIFLRYAIPTTHYDQAKENPSFIKMMDNLNTPDEMYNDHEPWNYYLAHGAKCCGFTFSISTMSYDKFALTYLKYLCSMEEHFISYELTQTWLYYELFRQLPSSIIKGFFDMLVAEGTFKYSRQSQQEISIFSARVVAFRFTDIKSIYHFRKIDVQKFRIPQQCRYLCILVDSYTGTFLTKLPIRIANNLRMLTLYKGKEETCLQLQKYQKASSIEIPKSLAKNLIILSIIDTGIQQLSNRISMLHRLRYLSISEKEMEQLPESIYDLYNLRVLSLSHCEKLLKLSEQIHNLAKLQILKLSYCTRLQKLPKSITSLVNLQVLDIEACHWVKELPKDLRYLERLISLNMIGCASLTQIPLGISKLTDLEALSGYMIDDYKNKSSTLKELQSLTNIEQLHLRHLERVLNINDITSVNLKEKKYLENLVLHWEWWNMDEIANDQIQSLEILDSFQPNVSQLKRLEIISYLGMQLPNWMMVVDCLKFLVELKLINLKRCESLPPRVLLHLHSLNIFELSGLDSLTYAGTGYLAYQHTDFANGNLTLSEMPNLVEWSAKYPNLHVLTLIHCPKLIRLSGFQLECELGIWLQSQMLGKYSTCFHSTFKHIRMLEIVGCQELRWLPEDIKNCEYLEKLSIIRCNKLLSMPDWLQEMPRLKKILILGCTRISYIPKELKQKLEDRIIIQGCPRLQAQTR